MLRPFSPSLAFLLPFFGTSLLLFCLWIRLELKATHSSALIPSGWQGGNGQSAMPWPGRESVKVYSPSKSNATVAICLIVRNETVYMDEWMDFHIALGFAPIFVYDNADTADLVLQSWYDRRKDIQQYVHIIHMPKFPVQGYAYEQCLRKDASTNSFAAMIDIDEFVVLKKHDNIVDFMVEHCDIECGQISLNWHPMGTSNETQYTPVPVTKRNINVHNSSWLSRMMFVIVKVIVRPTYVADYMDWSHSVMLKRGHWIDTSGTVIPRVKSTDKCCVPYEHRGPTDVGEIYHYKYKSEEEFYMKSCVRGDSLSRRGDMTKCGHMSGYGNFPRDGDAFDDLAWRQLKRQVPKYGILDRMRDVALY